MLTGAITVRYTKLSQVEPHGEGKQLLKGEIDCMMFNRDPIGYSIPTGATAKHIDIPALETIVGTLSLSLTSTQCTVHCTSTEKMLEDTKRVSALLKNFGRRSDDERVRHLYCFNLYVCVILPGDHRSSHCPLSMVDWLSMIESLAVDDRINTIK